MGARYYQSEALTIMGKGLSPLQKSILRVGLRNIRDGRGGTPGIGPHFHQLQIEGKYERLGHHNKGLLGSELEGRQKKPFPKGLAGFRLVGPLSFPRAAHFCLTGINYALLLGSLVICPPLADKSQRANHRLSPVSPLKAEVWKAAR